MKGNLRIITGGSEFAGSTSIGRLAEDSRLVLLGGSHRDSPKGRSLENHAGRTAIVADVLDLDGLSEATDGSANVGESTAELIELCARVDFEDAVLPTAECYCSRRQDAAVKA